MQLLILMDIYILIESDYFSCAVIKLHKLTDASSVFEVKVLIH